ncbi:MAG: response regulator [Gallionella sp.]|nr:response regulator [Gallionella sp.]
MKVFIVEDSEEVRRYLQSMLSGIPGVSVVGCAVDELGAIKQICELLPDVVTLDLGLQSGSGIAVLEYIRKHHDAIKVIVLTNYVDDFYTNSCKGAGADYVFDKTFQFEKVRSVLWSLVHASHPEKIGLINL